MALRKGSKPFLVGFPPGLKERAADAARRDGRSLSNWIIRLIEREVTTVTSYPDSFARATERMIAALRAAGHTVECPVTGSVWVNGVEIRPNDWDRLAMMGEVEDVLEFVGG